MPKTKIAIVYQVIFHYRIPFYEKIFNEPGLDSILYYGKNNPYNKNKSYTSPYVFKTSKLSTLFIPFGKDAAGQKSVMPVFPSLFFRLIFQRPDIVLSEGASSLPNALMGFVYCKIFRKRYIWWSLGSIKKKNFKLNKFKALADSLTRYIEINSSAIFTYSSAGRQYFITRGVKPENIFVGVNVIDTSKRVLEIKKINDLIVKNEHVFQILFVGAIIKEKRLELLIDAYTKLYQIYKDKVRLVIVGEGNYLQTIKSYANNSLANNILFTGKIIDGVSKYFLESDVFVLPGLGGLAISDAMIHGLPVIATNADGTEQDLVSPETGFIIDNLTTEEIFGRLELLLLNPDLRKAMSLAAYERITNNFSFDKYFSKFKKMIDYLKN
jgi:glycosyltransferase involved in cell wall biosynthesis